MIEPSGKGKTAFLSRTRPVSLITIDSIDARNGGKGETGPAASCLGFVTGLLVMSATRVVAEYHQARVVTYSLMERYCQGRRDPTENEKDGSEDEDIFLQRLSPRQIQDAKRHDIVDY